MRSFTRRELAANTLYMSRHFLAFRRRPFAPRETVRANQLACLQQLVRFAYDNVPLYREKYDRARVHPRDLQTLQDIARFPTVSKEDVLAAFPQGALARGLDMRKCLVSKSSGSTGQVLNVVHQADRLGIQGLAMHRLFELYTPYLPWHRLVYVYTSEYPSRSLFGLYPMNLIPTLTPMPEILARIKQLRPHLLACYPSHLRELAHALGPAACRELRLAAVSVSSELSTQTERDELAAFFGCGVYDEYSTEELTHVATQCRHKTYHLFEDVVYVEIVAGDSDLPLAPGERGEIVGTYLHNFAMPFIRYRQGDFAALDDSYCSCGRTFRAIKPPEGRILDQFILPGGRVLTSGWLLDASYNLLLDVGADIAAFTLIQETLQDVTIEIVPGPAYAAWMSEAVCTRFRQLVGEPLNVRVDVVPALKRAGGGKHHPIVSRVG